MHRQGAELAAEIHDESHHRRDPTRRKFMTQYIAEVDDSNFKQIVLESKHPVLVDFWAPWCGPCLSLGPIVESVAEQYAGTVQVVKLNVDDNPSIALRYCVQAIPTLILFRDGEERDRLIGARSKEAIARTIDAQMGAASN
jgi:thioredoxin 1